MEDVNRVQLEFSTESEDEAEYFNDLYVGLVRSVQETVLSLVTHKVL